MNRNAYLKKLKAQLDQWSAELQRLETKARGAGQDVRIKYENEIDAVREQMDKAESLIDEIQSAGEDMWENLKDDAEDVWSSIMDAMEDTKAAIR